MSRDYRLGETWSLESLPSPFRDGNRAPLGSRGVPVPARAISAALCYAGDFCGGFLLDIERGVGVVLTPHARRPGVAP